MRKLPSVQKNLSIGALNILRPPKGTKATADFWHVLGDIAAILLVLVTYGVEKCVRTHLPHYSNHWDPQLLFEWLFIIKKNYGLFVDFLTSEGWCLKITEKVSLESFVLKNSRLPLLLAKKSAVLISVSCWSAVTQSGCFWVFLQIFVVIGNSSK